MPVIRKVTLSHFVGPVSTECFIVWLLIWRREQRKVGAMKPHFSKRTDGVDLDLVNKVPRLQCTIYLSSCVCVLCQMSLLGTSNSTSVAQCNEKFLSLRLSLKRGIWPVQNATQNAATFPKRKGVSGVKRWAKRTEKDAEKQVEALGRRKQKVRLLKQLSACCPFSLPAF